MKANLLFLLLWMTHVVSAQVFVGTSINQNSFLGGQLELGAEVHLIPQLHMVARAGSHWNGAVTSFRFGVRGEFYRIKKTGFLLGLDYAQFHSTVDRPGSVTRYRHFDLTGGVSYNFSYRIKGIFEVGVRTKRQIEGAPLLVMRLGFAYRIFN